MSDLKNLSDEELQAELHRREETRAAKEAAERLEHEKAWEQAKLGLLVLVRENPEIFLALTTHTRTSCSDENPQNERRCDRCTLQALLREEWVFSEEWEVEFRLKMG